MCPVPTLGFPPHTQSVLSSGARGLSQERRECKAGAGTCIQGEKVVPSTPTRHDLPSWLGVWRGEGDGFASEAAEPGLGPGGLTPEAVPGVPAWTEGGT